jgi:hypothetical protein
MSGSFSCFVTSLVLYIRQSLRRIAKNPVKPYSNCKNSQIRVKSRSTFSSPLLNEAHTGDHIQGRSRTDAFKYGQMSRVRDLAAPMHLGLYKPALCAPCPMKGAPKHYWSFQMAPRLIFWIYLGSKKKEPRCACLSEAKASNSQRIWAEIFSITLNFLHNGPSCSPKT